MRLALASTFIPLLGILATPAEAAPAPEDGTMVASQAPPRRELPAQPLASHKRDRPVRRSRDLPRISLPVSGGELGVSFNVQVLTLFDHYEIDGQPSTNTTGVRFRRIRETLRGTFLDRRVAFKLQINTVPGAVELIDAWAGYKLHKQALLRIGQIKIPYTHYRELSNSVLDLVDWSIATNYFGSERQMGARLDNGHARARWEYAVGVYTGQSARASHGVGIARVYGEKVANPSSFSNAGPLEEPHPELGARGTVHLGGKEKPWKLMLALSSTWDLRPTYTHDLALRFAAEARLRYRNIGLRGIGYLGLFESGDDKIEAGLGGVLAEASWQPIYWLRLALRYTRVERFTALNDDAQAYGAAKIAAAQGNADALAAAEKQYGGLGLLRAEQELDFGLNFYVYGDSLKAQTDVAWVHSSQTGADPDDVRVRIQLQFRL